MVGNTSLVDFFAAHAPIENPITVVKKITKAGWSIWLPCAIYPNRTDIVAATGR